MDLSGNLKKLVADEVLALVTVKLSKYILSFLVTISIND
jgi:hypothetical protein